MAMVAKVYLKASPFLDVAQKVRCIQIRPMKSAQLKLLLISLLKCGSSITKPDQKSLAESYAFLKKMKMGNAKHVV